MTGFVEERFDVAMREGCWARLPLFFAGRAGEVAAKVGNGCLNAVSDAAAGDGLVHPRATALGFAGIGVKIELADQGALAVLDAEKADVLVPGWSRIRFDAHVVQRFGNMEEPSEHFRLGEVGLDLLRREVVSRLSQFFRGVGVIPGLERCQPQFRRCEGAQFGDILFGERLGFARQIVQKTQDLRHGFGHLGNQRYGGEVVVAEQQGLFFPQFEDTPDQRGVVEFRRAEFGGACGRGTVECRTQSAAVGELLHGPVRRHVQGEFPARFAVFFRCFARGLDDIGREAGQIGFVGHEFGEGVSGVEQVFGEFGGE